MPAGWSGSGAAPGVFARAATQGPAAAPAPTSGSSSHSGGTPTPPALQGTSGGMPINWDPSSLHSGVTTVHVGPSGTINTTNTSADATRSVTSMQYGPDTRPGTVQNIGVDVASQNAMNAARQRDADAALNASRGGNYGFNYAQSGINVIDVSRSNDPTSRMIRDSGINPNSMGIIKQTADEFYNKQVDTLYRSGKIGFDDANNLIVAHDYKLLAQVQKSKPSATSVVTESPSSISVQMPQMSMATTPQEDMLQMNLTNRTGNAPSAVISQALATNTPNMSVNALNMSFNRPPELQSPASSPTAVPLVNVETARNFGQRLTQLFMGGAKEVEPAATKTKQVVEGTQAAVVSGAVAAPGKVQQFIENMSRSQFDFLKTLAKTPVTALVEGEKQAENLPGGRAAKQFIEGGRDRIVSAYKEGMETRADQARRVINTMTGVQTDFLKTMAKGPMYAFQQADIQAQQLPGGRAAKQFIEGGRDRIVSAYKEGMQERAALAKQGVEKATMFQTNLLKDMMRYPFEIPTRADEQAQRLPGGRAAKQFIEGGRDRIVSTFQTIPSYERAFLGGIKSELDKTPEGRRLEKVPMQTLEVMNPSLARLMKSTPQERAQAGKDLLAFGQGAAMVSTASSPFALSSEILSSKEKRPAASNDFSVTGSRIPGLVGEWKNLYKREEEVSKELQSPAATIVVNALKDVNTQIETNNSQLDPINVEYAGLKQELKTLNSEKAKIEAMPAGPLRDAATESYMIRSDAFNNKKENLDNRAKPISDKLDQLTVKQKQILKSYDLDPTKTNEQVLNEPNKISLDIEAFREKVAAERDKSEDRFGELASNAKMGRPKIEEVREGSRLSELRGLLNKIDKNVPEYDSTKSVWSQLPNGPMGLLSAPGAYIERGLRTAKTYAKVSSEIAPSTAWMMAPVEGGAQGLVSGQESLGLRSGGNVEKAVEHYQASEDKGFNIPGYLNPIETAKVSIFGTYDLARGKNPFASMFSGNLTPNLSGWQDQLAGIAHQALGTGESMITPTSIIEFGAWGVGGDLAQIGATTASAGITGAKVAEAREGMAAVGEATKAAEIAARMTKATEAAGSVAKAAEEVSTAERVGLTAKEAQAQAKLQATLEGKGVLGAIGEAGKFTYQNAPWIIPAGQLAAHEVFPDTSLTKAQREAQIVGDILGIGVGFGITAAAKAPEALSIERTRVDNLRTGRPETPITQLAWNFGAPGENVNAIQLGGIEPGRGIFGLHLGKPTAPAGEEFVAKYGIPREVVAQVSGPASMAVAKAYAKPLLGEEIGGKFISEMESPGGITPAMQTTLGKMMPQRRVQATETMNNIQIDTLLDTMYKNHPLTQKVVKGGSSIRTKFKSTDEYFKAQENLKSNFIKAGVAPDLANVLSSSVLRRSGATGDIDLELAQLMKNEPAMARLSKKDFRDWTNAMAKKLGNDRVQRITDTQTRVFDKQGNFNDFNQKGTVWSRSEGGPLGNEKNAVEFVMPKVLPDLFEEHTLGGTNLKEVYSFGRPLTRKPKAGVGVLEAAMDEASTRAIQTTRVLQRKEGTVAPGESPMEIRAIKGREKDVLTRYLTQQMANERLGKGATIDVLPEDIPVIEGLAKKGMIPENMRPKYSTLSEGRAITSSSVAGRPSSSSSFMKSSSLSSMMKSSSPSVSSSSGVSSSMIPSSISNMISSPSSSMLIDRSSTPSSASVPSSVPSSSSSSSGGVGFPGGIAGTLQLPGLPSGGGGGGGLPGGGGSASGGRGIAAALGANKIALFQLGSATLGRVGKGIGAFGRSADAYLSSNQNIFGRELAQARKSTFGTPTMVSQRVTSFNKAFGINQQPQQQAPAQQPKQQSSQTFMSKMQNYTSSNQNMFGRELSRMGAGTFKTPTSISQRTQSFSKALGLGQQQPQQQTQFKTPNTQQFKMPAQQTQQFKTPNTQQFKMPRQQVSLPSQAKPRMAVGTYGTPETNGKMVARFKQMQKYTAKKESHQAVPVKPKQDYSALKNFYTSKPVVRSNKIPKPFKPKSTADRWKISAFKKAKRSYAKV